MTLLRSLAGPLRLLCALAASSLCACVTPGLHQADAPVEDGFVFVDVGDAWLRVKQTGPTDSDKMPVLLLHGFGSRLDTWNKVQDALDDDRVVISFDHKGFGHSERSDGAYGPKKHAEDALAVLAALGVDRAVVAGHSYGGGVALRMLLADQALGDDARVAGLVLVDAFALESQVPSSFRVAKTPVLGEFIFSTLFTEMPGEKYVLAFHDGQRFATARVLNEVRALQARPGSTFAELQTVRHMDYAAVEGGYAAAVKDVPRVLVWGENDKVTPLRHGKAMSAALDAPLIVVPECGHVPSWERPSVVVDAIRGVLASAEANAGAVPTTARRSTPSSSSSAPPASSAEQEPNATPAESP